MINYHKEFVAALEAVLPVTHEAVFVSDNKPPCISYMELTNNEIARGDTIIYSRLQFQVTIWAYDVETLQIYAPLVDDKLRPLGWRRTGAREMYNTETGLMRKILTYEAMAIEEI